MRTIAVTAALLAVTLAATLAFAQDAPKAGDKPVVVPAEPARLAPNPAQDAPRKFAPEAEKKPAPPPEILPPPAEDRSPPVPDHTALDGARLIAVPVIPAAQAPEKEKGLERQLDFNLELLSMFQ